MFTDAQSAEALRKQDTAQTHLFTDAQSAEALRKQDIGKRFSLSSNFLVQHIEDFNMTTTINVIDDVLTLIEQYVDQAQDWSDQTFGGKYRDAAETLLCGMFLALGYIAIACYIAARNCVVETLSYWREEAQQQQSMLTGIWIELLPAPGDDACWTALEAETAILADEIAIGAIPADHR